MPVETVNDEAAFDAAQQRAGANRLLVVDFYADWCGPCKMVAPIYQDLSRHFEDAIFIKVNVDRCQMLARRFDVRAMPTFVVFENGQERGRIQGADVNRLQNLIGMYYRPVKESPRKANPTEREWLHGNLVSKTAFVKQYEDEVTRMMALSVVPAERLEQASLVDGKRSDALLAKNLMSWFHDDFFKWVDSPPCNTCTGPTKSIGEGTPSDVEKEDGAGRVEIFQCEYCHDTTRFPRYNKVATLIDTRRGRCGEWANCFTLFCRAVGLEARYVFCTEDHVWTEIFDSATQNWIHCDPCENAMDRPHLYEKGWKKELRYVFAIAHDHCQDVSFRYYLDHKLGMKRRILCREPVLLNCITKLNARLGKELRAERRNELTKRCLRELVELTNPKFHSRSGDDVGRVSGGLDWRESRMEADLKPGEPVQISLTEEEIAAKKFILEYDVVNDAYRRPNSKLPIANGFKSLLYQSENAFRKVEPDHKQAYLCRTPGSKSADISWKISLKDLKAKKVTLDLGQFTLFNKAKANATLCGGMLCNMVEDDGHLEAEGIDDAEYIEISIHLRGGEGEVAWQHAQAFRTAIDEPKTNLRIELDLE